MSQLKKPDFLNEFRLGLVVYGGVSLAIYMNGVCQEFFNAVRGRGIYKIIKALTNSDIVVDIISGTSAGGVNGVLLSYALTNSNESYAEGKVIEFKDFAKIWRDNGSIYDLLRRPGKNRENADSILDGDYYQSALANALNLAQPESPRAENDWYSPFSELDLFVTGTDIEGKVYQTFDNTGKVIEIKNNRAVFELGYRESIKDKNPFKYNDEVLRDALAKLCRITSCFPVAFPVVEVQVKNRESEDAFLTQWGKLDNREFAKDNIYFVDGGVLDNRPFSYTIRQIYSRTANRPAHRKLLYIDPTPDSFLNTDSKPGSSGTENSSPKKPNIWQSALYSLVDLPRYESIATDLEEIKEHNNRVKRYKLLRSSVERELDSLHDLIDGKLKSLVDSKEEQDDSSEKKTYLRCRLIALRDRILPLILQTDITGSNNNQDERLQKAASVFLVNTQDPDNKLKGREDILNQLGKEIWDLDVYYALRKNFYFSEQIHRVMQKHIYEFDKLHKLAKKISLQIERLKIIQNSLEKLFSLPIIGQVFDAIWDSSQKMYSDSKVAVIKGDIEHIKKEYWCIDKKIEPDHKDRYCVIKYLLCLHRFLLDNDGLDLKFFSLNWDDTEEDENKEDTRHKSCNAEDIDNLEKLKEVLDKRIENLHPDQQENPNQKAYEYLKEHILKEKKYYEFDVKENDTDVYKSFLKTIDLESEKIIGKNALEYLSKKNKIFPLIDQRLYPYQYLSDLHEINLIEIIRISPNDAKLGMGKYFTQVEKLAGDQLRAFGGFFKKSWRSNDILWGRLDGLNRIIEALITPETIKSFSLLVSREVKEHKVENSAYSEEDYFKTLVEESFPEIKEQEKTTLISGLKKIFDGSGNTDQENFKEFLKKFLNDLVMLGHQAILREDLSTVFEDALTEQLDWNQQAVLTDLRALEYKRVVPRSNGNSPQLKELGKIDQYLYELSEGKSSQPPKVPPALDGFIDNQEKLKDLLETAYPSLKDNQDDSSDLTRYFQTFHKNLSSRYKVSLEELYRLLELLYLVGGKEQKSPSVSPSVQESIKNINAQLDKVIKILKSKPEYGVVSGKFDKAVTPFAIQSLAQAPIKELMEGKDLENYFRRSYKVASEDLSRDIPAFILDDTIAQVGLIFRDILDSEPTGEKVRQNPLYQVVNKGLQAYYQFTQWNNSSVYRGNFWSWPLVKQLLGLAVFLIGVGGIAYLLNPLPRFLLQGLLSLGIILGLWAIALSFISKK
jgi:patatin-related protein